MGEPVINNTTVVSVTHTFRVGGPNFMNPAPAGPTRVVRAAELRIGLAWPDVPSVAGSGGPLVNDLDLVLESPGPDGCLFAGDIRWDGATCGAFSPADNLFYDGNVYDGGHANAITDQWSRPRGVGAPERHDMRDPQEGIHLTSDPNADRDFSDSPLYIGLWRVTVKRGAGGAIPGTISNVGLNEDVNQNGRLDPGEDTDGDGLLDL